MSFLSRLFGKKPEISENSEEKLPENINEEVVVEEYFYVHEQPKVSKKEDDMLVVEEPNSDTIVDSTGGTGLLSYKDPGPEGKVRTVTPEEAAQICKGNIPDGIVVPGVTIRSGGQVPDFSQRARVPTNQPKNPKLQPVQTPNQNQPQKESAHYYPPTEVVMVEGAYHLYVDLPGVKKESLNIVFDDSTLVISGERESSVEILKKSLKKPHQKKDPILQAKSTIAKELLQRFEFKYPFKKRIEESEMQATLDHGILHITLPHRFKGEQINVPIM
jgi:HSP20 family molecular chaperone IbpA